MLCHQFIIIDSLVSSAVLCLLSDSTLGQPLVLTVSRCVCVVLAVVSVRSGPSGQFVMKVVSVERPLCG